MEPVSEYCASVAPLRVPHYLNAYFITLLIKPSHISMLSFFALLLIVRYTNVVNLYFFMEVFYADNFGMR